MTEQQLPTDPSRETMFVRGTFRKESSFRIISMIIALCALSFAWLVWLSQDLSFIISKSWNLNNPSSFLAMTLTDVSLGSLVFIAVISYALIPRGLQKKGSVYCSEGTKLGRIVYNCKLATRINKVPRVFLGEESSGLVSTCGRTAGDSEIIVSNKLVDSMDEEELSAMIFHELGHVSNGDVALMTWAHVFQKSLKYWAAFYVFVQIGIAIVLNPSVSYWRDWIRLVFFGSGLSYSILLPLMIYVFVTFAVSSASRVREFAADDFACDYVKPSVLVSSMRSSVLHQIAVNAPHAGIRQSKSTILLPPWLHRIKNLQASHPRMRDRLRNLAQKEDISKIRISTPTIETSVWAGIVAALVMIGLNELMFRMPASINPIINWSGLVWLAGQTVPLVVLAVSNTLFFWYNPEALMSKSSKGALHLRKDFMKVLGVNVLVACVSFFLVGVATFYPRRFIDLYFVIESFPAYNAWVLETIQFNLASSICAALMCCLSLLLLGIVRTDHTDHVFPKRARVKFPRIANLN